MSYEPKHQSQIFVASLYCNSDIFTSLLLCEKKVVNKDLCFWLIYGRTTWLRDKCNLFFKNYGGIGNIDIQNPCFSFLYFLRILDLRVSFTSGHGMKHTIMSTCTKFLWVNTAAGVWKAQNKPLSKLHNTLQLHNQES